MHENAVVINWFEAGQLGGVKLEQVWDVLGDLVIQEDADLEERCLRWTVQYPRELPISLKLSADGNEEDLVTSLIFPRRPASDLFWLHLYQLVSLGHGVGFLDRNTPIVTHEDSIPHLPSGLIVATGPPHHIGDHKTLARLAGT